MSQTTYNCSDCYNGTCRTENGVVECPHWNLPMPNEKCPLKAREWADRLRKAGIFERYCRANFNVLKPRPGQDVGAFNAVKEYAETGKYTEENLILKGHVGTGKTTLAVAVLQHALEHKTGGLFLTVASLLDNIFTLKASNMEEWVKYERALKDAGLLVLDDVGYEHSEGWVLTKLDAIISERYNRCKPIVMTTNLTTEQLRGRYSQHILDRLRESAVTVNMTGRSLRAS